MIETNTPPPLEAGYLDALFHSADFGVSDASEAYCDSIHDVVAEVAEKARQGRLDKEAATLTPEPRAKVKETVTISRWRLKHSVSNLLRDGCGDKTPGVCKCGTAGFQTEQVSLVRKDGKAGVRGVYYCDSPWVCPTCAPRRAAERAEKVTQVFDAVEARGGRVVFITLTVKHAKKDDLLTLKKMVMDACRKARQGKPWALATERYGIVGTLVSPEVTWSEKYGWHFHLHVGVPMLIPDREQVSGETFQQFHDRVNGVAAEGGEWIVKRYLSYIRQAGGRASRKGQDVQVTWHKEDLADYLAKGSAAWEIASAGATKEGKAGRNPWDLAALASRGDAAAASLFREYAAVMPGTRACVISKSMADKLGIKPSDDSDKPRVEQVDNEEIVVGTMEAPRWHRVLRRGYAADVLKAVQQGCEWPQIDGLIGRMLGEEPDEILSVDSGPRVHEPTAISMAMEACSEAHRFNGRKGAALQIVLQRHRDFAQSRNRVFVGPDLREVLELMGR